MKRDRDSAANESRVEVVCWTMDLLSSRPFWPIRDGLPTTFPPLETDTSCDVAIVGGGISGAVTAWQLTASGHDVVLLDRREVAHGSTAGNTGLLLYELDVMLHRLARRLGRTRAERAYRRCRGAVADWERLVRTLRIDCGFQPKSSLQLAATPAHVPRLRREYDARRAAGLKVDWWSRERLRAESTLPHSAAIFTREAAQLDVYRLTYGLLTAARRRGARIHDRTGVVRRRCHRTGIELQTSRGHRVRARQLVICSGYEAAAFLPEPVGSLHSTFAAISEPIGDDRFIGWPGDRNLLWDTADPYLYLRTTPDGRAIIGGYDVPFAGPERRDRLLRAKTAALRRRFAQLFPRIPFEIYTSWAGTFGVSDDGLPFIGRHPRVPRTWFALGFGGNGTTFSLIAATMIGRALAGESDPDTDIFGFERCA